MEEDKTTDLSWIRPRGGHISTPGAERNPAHFLSLIDKIAETILPSSRHRHLPVLERQTDEEIRKFTRGKS